MQWDRHHAYVLVVPAFSCLSDVLSSRAAMLQQPPTLHGVTAVQPDFAVNMSLLFAVKRMYNRIYRHNIVT
jgi:hypothetical protein